MARHHLNCVVIVTNEQTEAPAHTLVWWEYDEA